MTVSKKLMIFVLLAVFAVTAVVTGCGQQQPAAGSKPKVLRVGSETTYPPFEFQDENSKEFTGFDIELMKAIGKQMGYEVQISGMNFDGLIPALEAGQIDVIASAMTITDERAKKVSFTQPYYRSGVSILVKKDNEAIKGFNDLDGKRIGVQIGTTSADEAKKIAGAKVSEFNTTDQANMELKAGGVDAVLNDLPVNEYYLVQGGAKDAKLVGEPLNAEEFGFAAAKKDAELAGKINKALEELKKNGEYEKIYMKWFGKKPQ